MKEGSSVVYVSVVKKRKRKWQVDIVSRRGCKGIRKRCIMASLQCYNRTDEVMRGVLGVQEVVRKTELR